MGGVFKSNFVGVPLKIFYVMFSELILSDEFKMLFVMFSGKSLKMQLENFV